MEKFCLEGFYVYDAAPNGRGELTGEIECAEDGSFEGQIYDHVSSIPEQTMKGFLHRDGDLETLVFLKFPSAAHLANLAYTLQKESNDTFQGQYVGEWKALPLKVRFCREYNLFIAQMDMSVCGIGDRAELTLYKK